MHFENVSLLLNHILEVINEQKFCWLDKHGRICLQFGVFRVNCIDCLDRTNVVQTAIAKTVMEIVFTKLGLIAPENAVPANIRNAFQVLWANNGDALSRQYAGTNALKVNIFLTTNENVIQFLFCIFYISKKLKLHGTFK